MTSIIITLLIVLYKIPLINILGDKCIGYYSIALTLYMFLMTFLAYGIPKALSTLIAEQYTQGKYALAYKTSMSTLLYTVFSGGICSILLFWGADIIAVYLLNAVQSSMAIRAIAPCLLFVSVLGALHGIYTGTKAASISKTAQWIENIFVAVLSVLGAYITKSNAELYNEPAYGSMGAALGLTCGVFIACVFSLILFLNYRKKLLRKAKKEESYIKTSRKELILLLIKTMLPFILTVIIYHFSKLVNYALFNYIMNVQGHKENSYIILLGMLNGKYEFFISIPLLFVIWYTALKVPVISKIVQEGNKRKLFRYISKYTRYIMIYIIPCTALYILYAKPLMDLLFVGINDTPAILLRIGAITIIFYSLAVISNAVLNALDDWAQVVKNVLIAFIVQIISLLIMMIIFQWTIPAVIVSRIIFSSTLFILNEHVLREQTGYIFERKRSFSIPFLSAMIMSGISFVIYFIFNLFMKDTTAVIIAIIIAIPVYILAMIFTGGITQHEMYRLPGGKYLAPLCRKLHLLK